MNLRYSPSSIQSFSINRITVPIPLKTIIKEYKSDDKTAIDKALEILRKYGLSKVYSKDIKIVWENLGNTDYAKASPGLFGISRNIKLNSEYKDVLIIPEYLAIILAHELSHQYDYDLLDISVVGFATHWAYRYITEEKGYSVQLFVYEKLLKEKPYLFDENKIKYEKVKIFIETNNFLKAVWDYKNNNGKIPKVKDFPKLNETKISNIINSLEYDKDFIVPYTFHSFVTLKYTVDFDKKLTPEEIKDKLEKADEKLKDELKNNKVMEKFIKVRDSLISDIYLPYCNTIGVKPPDSYCDIPSEISSGQSNQDSGNNGSSNYHDSPADDTDNNDNNSDDNQQPPNDNDGEIGLDPGPPPTPPENPPDVDWDGSEGHGGS
jgi:hypothetical protein